MADVLKLIRDVVPGLFEPSPQNICGFLALRQHAFCDLINACMHTNANGIHLARAP
jgi:hypothetical protein